MDKLNLPPYAVNVRKVDGMTKIFDVLRRRFVALTPEEWVRQHFVHYLLEHKGYSPTLMGNEISVSLNGTKKRCDTVLFSRDGLRPLMIIEYKAPSVAITQKVFDQICRYNMVLKVEYLVVTNGIRHYSCHIDYSTGSYTFLDDVPDYSEFVSSL